ncbi:MAG: DNA-processing protein DprA [Evtepia sp.]|uniref:DNA-processing protein DprA n=1 Tax=Evtepia sp. TaxID=2773933 RepID=UPI002A751511|nr:DNA-processing protein DprA [Evtepia sp.]MDY3014961.1 DNA-processing protein DprA [Evtepia sp.]
MSAIRHWLWLSTRGPSPGMYAARILEQFGTPSAAYFADEKEYDLMADLPLKVRQALRDKRLDEADRILHDCEQQNIQVLTMQDAAYPERLRQLDHPPCVLYVKGKLPRMDEEAAIAMVGARKASPYGVMTAGRLAMDLARQGALIVSGSAWGIDSAALKGALQAGGRVVSVLGNGIDVVYPTGNQDLYADIAAAGALVSEYPPGTPPLGEHFPVRNRLIAGLSLGVVVVEGTIRSGSLITAHWALEQNRDVYAVPGNINAPLSKGPNSLIRRGEAKLIQDAWDILEEYEYLYPAKIHPRVPLTEEGSRVRLKDTVSHLASRPKKKAKPELAGEAEPAPSPTGLVIDLSQDPGALTDDEAAILWSLQGGLQYTVDDLVERTSIPARRILSALTMLQVRQMVKEENGKRFRTEILLKGQNPLK